MIKNRRRICNTKAFFELLKSGLWEKEVLLLPFEEFEFADLYNLAQEQAVVGLVTAGLGHVRDLKVPREDMLTFISSSIEMEQRNRTMNLFIAEVFRQFNINNIHAILVKGQGIAQCYEKPLWRVSGDIDLLLDEENYQKAGTLLKDIADVEKNEVENRLHKGFQVGPWVIELHGTLRGRLYAEIDQELDKVQRELFDKEQVRLWNNEGTNILLPSPDNDVIFIFTHILQHFSQSGVGLRQICDLCRLLWMFRE